MYWIYSILVYILKAIFFIITAPFFLIAEIVEHTIDPSIEFLEKMRESSSKRNAEETCQKEITHKMPEKYESPVQEELTKKDEEEDVPDVAEYEDFENQIFLSQKNKVKITARLYPKKYDKSAFKKVWNARVLVKSMVKLMASYHLLDEITDDFEFNVHRARVASVLRAYTGLSFEIALNNLEAFSKGDFCDTTVSEERAKIIKEMMTFDSIIENQKERLEKCDINYLCCKDIFSTLMMYRVAIEKAMGVYSGFLESSTELSIGINKAKSIYNPDLIKDNDEVENLLVLLLGDAFNMSFSEKVLIEKYNYPTVSDHQIMDWVADNW